MTTLLEIKYIILGLIGDPPLAEDDVPLRGSSTTAIELLNGVVAGLDAITIKVFKPLTLAIVAEAEAAVLPAGLIEVESIYDIARSINIPQLGLHADNAPFQQGEIVFSRYPHGSVTFSTAVGDMGATLYYSAQWTPPVEDDDVLESPPYANLCVALYAASLIMLSKASGSSAIRQFNTKVDSGNPEHLPHIVVSNSMLLRFEDAMSRVPGMQKGSV